MEENVKQITLKKATIRDFDCFYLIRSEESNIYWTGHDKKPDYFNLKLWFEEQINSDKRQIFIIYQNGAKVGYCYLDILNNNQIEIGGLAISEEFQKKKIGTSALKKFCEMVINNYPNCEFFGWWPDINESSIKMGKTNGFYPTDETKPYFWPLENRTILTRKYVYKGITKNG